MLFVVQIVLREPINHISTAKFACLIFLDKYLHKRPTEYPNQPSALRPVAHSEDFLVLERLESSNLVNDTEMDLGAIGTDVDYVDRDAENALPSSEDK
jgi:hypothetical protein